MYKLSKMWNIRIERWVVAVLAPCFLHRLYLNRLCHSIWNMIILLKEISKDVFLADVAAVQINLFFFYLRVWKPEKENVF